jgi:hypothetical protein
MACTCTGRLWSGSASLFARSSSSNCVTFHNSWLVASSLYWMLLMSYWADSVLLRIAGSSYSSSCPFVAFRCSCLISDAAECLRQPALTL